MAPPTDSQLRPSRDRSRSPSLALFGALVVLCAAMFVQACVTKEVVGPTVNTVTVNPDSASVLEGATLSLTTTIRDADGNVLPPGAIVEWSSDDSTHATVDETGRVTALVRGTVTIRATYGGVSGTSTITVLPRADVAVSAASGPTSEKGGQATFRVRLTAAPTADVTIALSSSDTTEGRISIDELTFTDSDWDLEQLVTVTGQDDDLDDGDAGYSIVTSPAVSADGKYDGLDPDDVPMTNVDDESAGITVSPAGGPTTESGGTTTFTMVLNSKPSANVAIGLTSSDTTEGVITVDSVRFSTVTWDVVQTVTITGRDDALPDGNAPYAIVTAPAVSADPNYNGLDPDDVAVTNVDDETAGITVSAPSGPTSESGGQATFSVVLNAEPAADVTIRLASSDPGEGTISADSLVFTNASWRVAQPVTVTGVNDDVDDGDVPYTIVLAPATSADSNYDTLNADDVLMTNVDDDVAGITVSAPSGPTTESGGTATFTVRLNSEPTADVTIGLSSSSATEGTITIDTLTFTSGNWDVERTVTVTGQDDALADGNAPYQVVTAPAVSTDPDYGGLDAADVLLTNVDDETAGVTVSPISGPTTEAAGTATFTVVLNTQPTQDVTLGLSSSDPGEGVISTDLLTFTTTDWSDVRTITVTGQDDDLDDGDVPYLVTTSAAASGDPSYDGLDPDDVSVTNVDDDIAGVIVSAISGPTTEGGDAATFTMRLSSEPTAPVSVTVASSDSTEGLVTNPAGGAVSFDDTNWSVARVVTVTGQDDEFVDPNTIYTIVTGAAQSTDPSYDSLAVADVTVTNVDDETPGITVSPISRATTEGGDTASFVVSLANQPQADVTVALSSSDTTEGTVAPTSLTFNMIDWATPKRVVVTGVDDEVHDQNVVYTIVTAPSVSPGDPNYHGIDAADVSVTNVDDDVVGVSVYGLSGPTTEGGGTATFKMILTSRPTSDVTIGLSSSDPDEGTADSASVTFTSADWNSERTITVSGVDDDVDDGNRQYSILTAAASSADASYDGLDPADVTITNVDDDVAGFAISSPSGPTTEAGGEATFTVRLTSEPAASVSFDLHSDDPTEGSVDRTTLTFTPANWDTLQTVTVTGEDDAVADGLVPYNVVTAAATSSDSLYDGLDPDDVSMTNVDNETPGIAVSPASGPTTEGGGQAVFSVVLGTEPTDNVTVPLSSSDLAEGTIDSTSVTFTPATWDIPHTVRITGQDDNIDDGDIDYFIVTEPATSADTTYDGLDGPDIPVTNQDDDTAFLSIAPRTVTEGHTGTVAAEFIVTLSIPSTSVVSYTYTTSDLSATGGSDYTPTSGTLAIGALVTADTITVSVIGDSIDEIDETFQVTLSNPVNASIATAMALGTITDDDPEPSLSIADATVNEGAGTATFDVTLSAESGKTVIVDYATSDGSATAGDDYTAITSGTLTFDPGVTSQQIAVQVTDDSIDEFDETFTVTLSSPDSASIADGTATGTITDDDPEPSLSIADATVNEGDGTATFDVTLSAQSAKTVTVAYATSDDSATAGDDYTATSGTLTFDPGFTSRTITVPILEDALDEDAEAFAVTLSSPDSATIADGTATGTINDNDDPPSLSVADRTVDEASGSVIFTVALSATSAKTVTIDYATSDGTATAGSDYTTAADTLTFDPGNTSRTITVFVLGDSLDEDDETFTVTLSNPLNATFASPADSTATGTITDNDPLPSLSVADVTVNEGDGTATFDVTLSPQSGRIVTVAYATSDGTAAAGSDYTALTPGTLTFIPGDTSEPITVPILEDALDEFDETFTVTLSNPDSATITDGSATGIVTDNDPEPSLSIADATVDEGAGTATFDVTLSAASAKTVTVAYDSFDGTAAAGSDYTALTPGTLTFIPGDTSEPITVTILEDALDEFDETFTVTLSNPDNATIADGSAAGTVTDNDPEPSLSIADATVDEGAGTATFDVTLSAASAKTVTVAYDSFDGTAAAGSDYTAVIPGTLTFIPGDTSEPITVTILEDALDEFDETFTVTLSSPDSATISDGTATGTITDNDPLPELSIDDVAVTEGDVGTVIATFTVTLGTPSGRPVTVNFTTADNTAAAGSDYTGTSGTLSFQAGEVSKSINVTVLGDLLNEGASETFNVNLSGAPFATIVKATGVGTITDDDP